MEEKTQKDVLTHLQAKFDTLPPDTVLVPPTADDSDVTDVEFGDPKLMIGKGDPKLTPIEVKTITQFISNYPYSTLTYLCRVLNIKPSEAVTKVMAFEPCNSWWDEDTFADALKQDADKLTAEGWEPGVHTPDQLRGMVCEHFKPELNGENMEQAKIDEAEEDATFGDPKLMGYTMKRTNTPQYEVDYIVNFISGHPYTSFRSLCRRLNLSPADALKRILPLVPQVENCVWTEDEEVLSAVTAEANGEIERGWEPGIRPEPVTDEKLAELVEEHVRCQFNASRNWSVADLAHRSGRDAKDVDAATIQMCMGRVLSHFKYTEFDPYVDEVKWLLKPVEIADAAVNCEWIKTADRRITVGDFATYKTADGGMGITYLEPEKEK